MQTIAKKNLSVTGILELTDKEVVDETLFESGKMFS
jgi:hypothetical protein